MGLTVALVALATAYSSPPGAAAFAIAIGACAVVLGPRFAADRVAQAAVSLFAMMAGVIVARLTSSHIEALDMLSERTLLLGMPMLAVAGVRSCLDRPLYGERLTLLAALVALTAAGRAQTGLVFPVLAALTVGTALLALRVADPTRAPASLLQPRHYAGVVLGATVAGGLALVSMWSLPRMHDAMIARLLARAQRDKTGFSASMQLGSLDGMLQSDAVVLRVRGDGPPLLRGVVLSTYQSGRWETGDTLGVSEVVETETSPEPGAIEIEHARSRMDHYFLPLGATDVVSSTGFYNRDVTGVYRPADRAFAKRLFYRVGQPPKDPPPTVSDLQIPHRTRAAFTSIAEAWGARGLKPRDALTAIQSRLEADYRYSLTFDRDPKTDPVLDFLQVHKEGHCEYFASAFALLARAANVPARVVAGYRVSERSPLGYSIVRERNAHSWVEVWVDDHWETWDPTPAADLDTEDRSHTPWLAALFDGMRTGWEAIDDWFGRRSAFELSLALVLLVGLLVMVRALRGRRATTVGAAFEIPRELAALVEALKSRGVHHEGHETLGALGRKVSESGAFTDDDRADVQSALERWERHRYGGEGDEAEALDALARAARRAKTRLA